MTDRDEDGNLILEFLNRTEDAANNIGDLKRDVAEIYAELSSQIVVERAVHEWHQKGGVPLKHCETDLLGRSPDTLYEKDLAQKVSGRKVDDIGEDLIQQAVDLRGEEGYPQDVEPPFYIVNCTETYANEAAPSQMESW